MPFWGFLSTTATLSPKSIIIKMRMKNDVIDFSYDNLNRPHNQLVLILETHTELMILDMV